MDLLSLFKRKTKPARRERLVGVRRGFTAAKTDRLVTGWQSQTENINDALAANLNTLRARSRDAHLNNDFVRRFMSMAKVNVVGAKGVALQARSIGNNGKPDTAANEGIEAAWADWGQRENCDMAGRCSWVEMQHQAITTAAADGEILAQHIVGTDAGKYGYKVLHLDPDRLDARYNVDGRGGNKIRCGVESDSWGRPVAYHIRESVRVHGVYVATNGKNYQRIPANEIVHAFLPEHVDQVRGYPWTATALRRLKEVDAYIEAAIVNARSATKMGFITTPDGESYTGDDTDADGSVIVDFEPGVIEQLPAGFQFQGFDPKYPHEQFGPFVKSMLQTIAGALGPGVTYSSLSGDLEGVNYSSIRAGLLEEREAWKAVQEWFIGAYCSPIFNRWLRMALLTQQITTPSATGKPMPLNPAKSDKYARVSWQPRRWPWVDPSNDADANLKLIGANISTASAVIRDQGGDPDDVFVERAKELERMRELGLTDAQVIGG